MTCDTHGDKNSGTDNSDSNLRVEHRPELQGGTKLLRASSGIQVGCPVVDNASGDAGLADYFRWAPRSWPVEAWECRAVLSPHVEKTRFFLARGCEVVSTIMQTREWCSVSPGPGEPLRSWLGWTPLLRTPQFGGLAFPGCVMGGAASCCTCVHSGLGFSGHLPHCLGGRAALPLLVCVWAEGSCWATNWGSLLGATPGFVEGHRTSHGTLVCRWGCADVCEPELLRWARVVRSVA